jgi:hypothetical protein
MSNILNRESVNDTAKLIMHRLIARELLRDPSLVERARAVLEKTAVRFPDRSFIRDWQLVLQRPVNEIVSVLVDRGQEARRLRLSSPFVLAEGIDFKDVTLRRRIGRAARRVAARGAAGSERARLVRA